ncbi:universal stress protein [Nocardioides litoris]|uniref:universal stress protein n=1 Tax=Nocardioides litoris TaxID=1926648 RepID=UPI00112302B0|nr:universal stress protein [Nocardioides litoris]
MTIVVGYAAAKGDAAPLHLGAMLARSAGHDLVVVTAVPAPWPTPLARAADREFEAWARDHGDRTVATVTGLLAEVCPDVPSRAVARPGKEAAALLGVAEETGAALVVVGSGADGPLGGVVVSSTADRLLHSSPVPVAVAPRGFRVPAGATVTRATCAFRGDDASGQVLERTAAICRAVGAALRVVTFAVRGRTMYPPEVDGESEVLQAYVEHTVTAQRAAVAALGDLAGTGPRPVETAVATGRTWPEALDGVAWERTDVLVVGSSAAGVVARLFLGSTATRILRASPVPVVVVP